MKRWLGVALTLGLLGSTLTVFAQDDTELTETYEGETISFLYPEDWVVEEIEGLYVIANTENNVEGAVSEFEDDDIAIVLAETVDDLVPDIEEFEDVEAAVESFVEFAAEEAEVEGPETETLSDDREAAYAIVTEEENNVETLLMLFELSSGDVAALVASVAVGAGEDYIDFIVEFADNVAPLDEDAADEDEEEQDEEEQTDEDEQTDEEEQDDEDSTSGDDLTFAGEVDDDDTAEFEFEASEGDVVTIRVNGEGDFDPVTYLYNEDGDEIGYNDDGDGLDSVIEEVEIEEDGTYVIEVEGFAGFGGEFEVEVEIE